MCHTRAGAESLADSEDDLMASKKVDATQVEEIAAR